MAPGLPAQGLRPGVQAIGFERRLGRGREVLTPIAPPLEAHCTPTSLPDPFLIPPCYLPQLGAGFSSFSRREKGKALRVRFQGLVYDGLLVLVLENERVLSRLLLPKSSKSGMEMG